MKKGRGTFSPVIIFTLRTPSGTLLAVFFKSKLKETSGCSNGGGGTYFSNQHFHTSVRTFPKPEDKSAVALGDKQDLARLCCQIPTPTFHCYKKKIKIKKFPWPNCFISGI